MYKQGTVNQPNLNSNYCFYSSALQVGRAKMLSFSASAFSLSPSTEARQSFIPTMGISLRNAGRGAESCGCDSADGDGGASSTKGTDRLECNLRGYHPKVPIFGPKKVSTLLGGFSISGMNAFSGKGADTS
jgi:hypothetical protein